MFDHIDPGCKEYSPFTTKGDFARRSLNTLKACSDYNHDNVETMHLSLHSTDYSLGGLSTLLLFLRGTTYSRSPFRNKVGVIPSSNCRTCKRCCKLHERKSNYPTSALDFLYDRKKNRISAWPDNSYCTSS